MRDWLRRWLGITDLEAEFDLSLADPLDPARIAVLEAALVSQREELNVEIAELRERLELPQRKKPSGRPFTVLRALAEEGARRAREKSSVNG